MLVSKWKLLSRVRLCDPMDSTLHGIFQARILEWVAFPFSKGSSQPMDRTEISHIAGRYFTSWVTREALVGITQELLLFSKLCLTLCNHMDCRTLSLLVLHYLLEFSRIGLNLSPLSQWCHPPISCSVPYFCSCL